MFLHAESENNVHFFPSRIVFLWHGMLRYVCCLWYISIKRLAPLSLATVLEIVLRLAVLFLEALVRGCVVRISVAIRRWYFTVAYLPFTVKMHRNCVSHPDNFCYVCGVLTFKSQRRHFTPLIKKCYEQYFGCKVGDQDKIWAPHMCCVTCVSLLTAWEKGSRHMYFAIPMVWREPKDHTSDC